MPDTSTYEDSGETPGWTLDDGQDPFLQVEALGLAPVGEQDAAALEAHGPLMLVEGPVDVDVARGLRELSWARVNLRSLQCQEVAESPLCSLLEDRTELLEEWLVAFHAMSVPGESCHTHSLRAAAISISSETADDDVGVVDNDPPPLQTKTVSLGQVRKELIVWKPSMKTEYVSLRTKDVARPITEKDIAAGKKVLRLPAKGVFTRKAISGLRRARCVACGNFAPSSGEDSHEHRVLTYAAGIDSSALRLMLSFIGQKPTWWIAITDVKAAFLNAKLEDGLEGTGKDSDEQEVIVVDPPRIFQQAEVVPKHERWLISGALYGLDRSPRCWSKKRDKSLKLIKICLEDAILTLEQLVAEPNAWLIKKSSSGTVTITGVLIVYVDDFMVGAVKLVAEKVLEAIRGLRQCSTPEFLTDSNSLRFCGVELHRDGRALLIHQAAYIADVVSRYEEKLGAPLTVMSGPFPKIQDPEEAEPPSPEALKRAQTLAGELLWVSGKTRVDIVYGVSRVTSLVSRCPEKAYQCGLHILGYLKGTSRVH